MPVSICINHLLHHAYEHFLAVNTPDSGAGIDGAVRRLISVIAMALSSFKSRHKSQINCLQQIQNCLARTVGKAPKSSRVTPILRSLHTGSAALPISRFLFRNPFAGEFGLAQNLTFSRLATTRQTENFTQSVHNCLSHPTNKQTETIAQSSDFIEDNSAVF